MNLIARPIDLEVGGKYIVIVNKLDAERLGLRSLDRVKIKFGDKSLSAIVEETEHFTAKGEIVTDVDVTNFFDLKGGEKLEVSAEESLESLKYVRQKIAGARLEYDKIKKIVSDVVSKKLSDIELSAFVTALYCKGLSIDEAASLSRAMVETGKRLKFPGKIICDKHSIGGIPGDKTSIVLVPIIAAHNLIIPKTSSKAITSACGTAERMSVLAPVNFSIDEIYNIVKKTNGCLVWGGALDLAPADDLFIKIEYPLGIDPLLLPSIMSKKKSIGATHVIIDIPTGRGAKIKNTEEARELAEDFIELGHRLGMDISCGITFGDQPLGYSIGSALEAKEALETLQGNGPKDLLEKATTLAGILLETINGGNKSTALEMIKSGKAEKKIREIIEAQGGNPEIKPEDIKLGEKTFEFKSENEGRVLWIKNHDLVQIARKAGSPRDEGAGIKLNFKMGDYVKKGDTLFTVYSDKFMMLEEAIKLAENLKPFVIGKKFDEKMILAEVFEKGRERIFMLER